MQGRNLSRIRLIYLGMMDSRIQWLEKMDGTSDGWGMKYTSTGWHAAHYPCPLDDFTPGKKYRRFIRTRGQVSAEATGCAWYAGVYNQAARKEPLVMSMTAEQVREENGQWRVHEVGAWTPQGGDCFYVALRDPAAIKEVSIDCYWLEEAAEAAPEAVK